MCIYNKMAEAIEDMVARRLQVEVVKPNFIDTGQQRQCKGAYKNCNPSKKRPE